VERERFIETFKVFCFLIIQVSKLNETHCVLWSKAALRLFFAESNHRFIELCSQQISSSQMQQAN